MKTKIALCVAFLITASYAHSAKFSVIINKEKNSYVTPEWFTHYEYTDWIHSGYPYDCVEEFRYEGVEVLRKETCNQDQKRIYNEYLKEKHTGEIN